jgi:ApeA N-terminal domain 1
MENYETRGRWWRPEEPHSDVAGTLQFSNLKGITLELDGVFVTDEQLWPNVDNVQDPVLLNGISDNGSRMTLVDAQRTGTVRSSSGYDRESYTIRYVLRGACIEREEDLSFDGHRLWYTGLPEWWSRTGLHSQGPIELDDAGHRTIRLGYTDQDPLTVRLADAELSVMLAWSDSGSRPRRHVEIREDVLLSIRTDDPLTLDKWSERYEGPLRELLTLATGRPALLSRLMVESPTILRELSGHSCRVPLEIDRPQHEPSELSSAWSPMDMLFSLDEIASDLGGVIQRWLDVRERYTLARQLYFSARYAPYMYKQTEFVNLVQACESYHAIRLKNRGRKSPEAHAQAVGEVLAAIPDKHIEWVEPRLEARSRISLEDRLLFLCHEHEDIIRPLLGSVESFCRRVVATRHFLTHGTRRSTDVITDMREILFADWVLRILFEACVLGELGIITPARINPFEGTSRYEHLRTHPLEL